MVRLALTLFSSIVLAAAVTHGQESPLTARVGEQGADVRSGPDAVHYATLQLPPGAEIEIYRLDPGRWCAVRPPDGSFCLVRAEAVEILDAEKGIGQVAIDGERCWIGTLLGQVEEPMWQLKLGQGERIRVLGSIPSADDESRAEWYQVAPPSGEFRWLHWDELDEASQQVVLRHFAPQEQDVASNEPKTVLVRENPAPQPSSQSDALAVAVAEAEKDDVSSDVIQAGFNQAQQEPRRSSPSEPPSQWRAPQKRRPYTPFDPAENRVALASTQFAPPVRQDFADHRPADANAPGSSPGGPTHWPQPLQELDLRLSLEVLKEPAQWRFESLLSEINRYRSSCTSPADLVIADHLLHKISQFQSIQRGTVLVPTPRGNSPVQGVLAVVGQESIPMVAGVSSAAVKPDASYAQTFDAFGWLNELVRDEGMGQTTYVLQDDNGKITHVISATPGLNLHRYLKQKIGIVGQKGFHQRMNLDHVTAERIVNLDTIQR